MKIEETIHDLIGDAPCLVVGIPDDHRGDRLALLYTQPEIAPGEIWRRLSESQLPNLWLPKRENIYLVETLPTLGSGKLDLQGAKAQAIKFAAVRASAAAGGANGNAN